MPLNGFEGMALSADGLTLAIGQKVFNLKKKQIEATIRLYDVSSGQELTTGIHDRIPFGNNQSLKSDFAVTFTPNGKHLIFSGALTKVWDIG